MAEPRELADRACPKCGYALRGLPMRTCPECGFNFEPSVLRWRTRHARRRRRLTALALMAVAIYAPFSWVLWIDDPWSDYRWHWVKAYPILPGLPTTLLLRSRIGDLSQTFEWVCMGALTLAALLLSGWLGVRGRWWLIATFAIVLALSCFNAFVAHAIFRA